MEEVEQCARLARLVEKEVCPKFSRPFLQGQGRIKGHHRNHDWLSGLMDPREDLEALTILQMDIEQYQIGAKRQNLRDRCAAGRRLPDELETGSLIDVQAECPAQKPGVFCNVDAHWTVPDPDHASAYLHIYSRSILRDSQTSVGFVLQALIS